MKISSVSKKVLASALSAAMVVAFAPTVALGATEPSVSQELSNAQKYVYEAQEGVTNSGYTYRGVFQVTGNTVTYTYSRDWIFEPCGGDEGQTKKGTADISRFLGALHYDANNSVTKITYNSVDYTWNGNGTNKGSNWNSDSGSLVTAIMNVLKSNLGSGLTATAEIPSEFDLDIDGTAVKLICQVANAGNTVQTSFNTGEGQLQANHIAIPSQSLKIDADGHITVDESKVDNAAYKLNGAAVTSWAYDEDGDGKISESETQTITIDGTDETLLVPVGATEVSLIAQYNVPAASTISLGGLNSIGAADDATVTPQLVLGNLENGVKYTAILEGPGVSVTDTQKASSSAATFDFGTVKVSKFSEGTYTYTVKDAEGVAVFSKELTVCKVTLDNSAAFGTYAAGDKTVFYVEKGTALNASVTFPKPVVESGSTVSFRYYAVNGNAVTDDDGKGLSSNAYEVTTDVALVATYSNPQVSAVSFTNGALSWSIANVTDTTGLESYTVEITGPVSATYTVKTTATSLNGSMTFGSTKEGQDSDSNAAYYTKAAAAAGTYTVKVTENFTKASGKASKTVGSKAITLAGISYEVGEGLGANGKAFDTKGLPTVIQAGTTLGDLAATINAAKPTTAADSANVFDKWTIAGKAVAADTKVDADTVVTAVYKTGKVLAPTFTLAANGEKYDLVFSCATEGASLVYSVNGGASWPVAAGTVVTVDPKTAFTVKVSASKNALASSSIELVSYKGTGEIATFTAFANTALNTPTSQSSTTAAQRYNDIEAVKATKKAGEDALTAIGYATEKDWAAAELAQEKAVLDAVVAAETANLDALLAGVANTDGTVSKIAKQNYDKAAATMALAVADYVAANDADDQTKPSTDSTATTEAGALAAIKKAVTDAKAGATSYAKADVEAAAAVTAQLQAAKTAAEAEAAVKAYAALTETQKQLVSGADIAAAESIIAAQAVKDAQDDAAVSKARNTSKTVKAGKNGKTGKKQSVTLKKITSKSGAKVTYKKSSGSSKITVKSGKAYLAKGVKKGTYKATVKATCGTQTAKIKVTFKVK